MLIRFVVSNFLSFNEEKEFNMLAGSFKTHKHHIYDLGKIEVLKGSAIYGANGAGKSNLVKAIDTLKELVAEGAVNKSINEKKFKLNVVNKDQPIHFEIEFYTNKKFFAYGLTIHNTWVIEEWLYESGITKEDKLIFERKLSKANMPSIKIADKYQKTQKARLLIELMEENLLKNNELLLSKSENLRIEEIDIVKEWFDDKLNIIYPNSKFNGLVPVIATSERFKTFANDLLRTFDTGIKSLEIETVDFEKFFGEEDEKAKKGLLEDLDNGMSVMFPSAVGNVLILREDGKDIVRRVIATHDDCNGKGVIFELNEESDGTKRLLDFIPAFDLILSSDVTIIIDEIDQSLHPALLKTLIHKVMLDESTQGQLIFTTHESNLLDLDIFRQDEIWFAEKDKISGGTQLYSLSEFKPRYDLDIRKGYLKGRFGAIPFLADLENLNWQDYDA
jgi:AAA15 family ATPase/GTPase